MKIQHWLFKILKEKKSYGRTDGRTDNVKTVYPPQTKFAGGIINLINKHMMLKTINPNNHVMMVRAINPINKLKLTNIGC